MTVLKAYGDESGKADAQCRAISLGAVIGEAPQWDHFNALWSEMLKRHQIEFLHMKDIIGARHTKRGQFARFNDPTNLDALLSEAVSCILASGIYCFGMSVFVDDLKIVLKRHQLQSDPFPFTLYAIVANLGTWALNNHPTSPAYSLTLDRMDKGYQKIAQAVRLYESDKWMSWRGWPEVTALKSNDVKSSRNTLELQAADLVAWTVRNEIVNIERWVRDVKPTLGPLNDERWNNSLANWLRDRIAEQAVTYPERRIFFGVWAKLMDAGVLRYYSYDEERLENHIIKSRAYEIDAKLKEESIVKAGRLFPLTTKNPINRPPPASII